MTAGDNTAGGYLVGTEHRADLFIESLRARSVAMSAGVRTLDGLTGNLAIPKQTGSASFYWLTEDEDVTNSDLSLGSVGLTPRTVAGAVPMTRRLLMQSSPSVEQMVRDDLISGAALAIDLAIFEGDGVTAPLGVVNHPTINTVAVSTDNAPTFEEMVSFETELATDNALAGALRYVTTPAIRGKLKTTKVDAGSGIFVAQGNEVNGYQMSISTQLAANRILFGDWSQVVVGFWGVLEVKPDEASKAASGGLVLRVFQDCDVAIRHGRSFAKGT
jgi:HK97 family phage major capsid protein